MQPENRKMNNQEQIEELRVFQIWVESLVDRVHPELGNSYRCQTGDPYVTLACGGLKLDTMPPPLLASNFDDLIEYSKEGFLRWIETIPETGKVQTLYWRQYPEVTKIPVGDSLFYSMTMRLVITEKHHV